MAPPSNPPPNVWAQRENARRNQANNTANGLANLSINGQAAQRPVAPPRNENIPPTRWHVPPSARGLAQPPPAVNAWGRRGGPPGQTHLSSSPSSAGSPAATRPNESNQQQAPSQQHATPVAQSFTKPYTSPPTSSAASHDAVSQNVTYGDIHKRDPFEGADLKLAEYRVQNLTKGLAAENNMTAAQAITSFGLRTGFSAENASNKQSKVMTNHLRLAPPPAMFVYTISMVRVEKNGEEDICVKQLDDKRKVWAHALTNIPQLVANHQCWATDYNLLWSIKPFFGVKDDEKQVDPVVHRVVGGNYRNDGGNDLSYASVKITFKEKLNCLMPTAVLFREADGVSTHDTTSALVTRGLNAFFTKHARQNTALTFIGGNKAYMKAPPAPLDNQALYALRGFFLSVRPGTERLYLNINPATSAFHVEGPINVLVDALGISFRQVTRMLKGVKLILDPALVEVGDTDIRYFVSADKQLGVQAARDTRQDSDTAHWYNFNAVWILRDQRFTGTLTGEQTARMIDVARRNPRQNITAIQTEGLKMFGFDNPAVKQQLPVSVGERLMVIPASWLAAPIVQYGSKALITMSAQWNLRDSPKFSKPKQVTSLRYLNLSGRSDTDSAINNMFTLLKSKLSQHGIGNSTLDFRRIVNQPNISAAQSTSEYENNVIKVLAQIPQAERAQGHLLVLIKKEDFDLYSYIKRVAELKLGIKTILCVVKEAPAPNNNRGPPPPRGQNRVSCFTQQNASNVALKFNLKNSGCNHHLAPDALAALRSSDTIVIGADVTHPGGGAFEGTPSIAAVVGTTDDEFMHFPGSMRLQRSKKEDIVELGDMVKERLIDWALKHGNRLPKRVLFYRDGVSESQYAILRRDEIPQIQIAFKWAKQFLDKSGGRPDFRDASSPEWPETDLKPNTKAKDAEEKLIDRTQGDEVKFELTYVVVGKRHNVRFYPANPDDGDKNGNVRPGMVVDSVVTHPTSFDFYLQSHDPIVGTGRSAHYFVLTNGMNLDTSTLQNVTHAFCYAYAVATKGVSYCAPAYYADRLCDRGRAYLRQYLTHKDKYHPQFSRGKKQSVNQFNVDFKNWLRDDEYWRVWRNVPKYGVRRRNPWHPNLDDVMFYL